MRASLLAFFLVCTALASAQTCHYGQGETGLNADLKALRVQSTCASAYALYRRCLWGSSADPARAEVVQQKCVRTLKSKLTPAQDAVLHEKLELCTLEYQGMDGTLWLSEESSCGLKVYVDFATDPAKASQPLPRASFDCMRAQNPVEHAVCGDPELGRFDLLMAGAYKNFLGELKAADKPGLVKSQRAWGAATAAACSVTTAPTKPAALGCLRKRYRARLQSLDGCAAGADVGCLENTGAP